MMAIFRCPLAFLPLAGCRMSPVEALKGLWTNPPLGGGNRPCEAQGQGIAALTAVSAG